MEGFRIDLKTFLGLAMPKLCSQTARIKVDIKQVNLGQNSLTFMIPIYSIPLYYMMLPVKFVTCQLM